MGKKRLLGLSRGGVRSSGEDGVKPSEAERSNVSSNFASVAQPCEEQSPKIEERKVSTASTSSATPLFEEGHSEVDRNSFTKSTAPQFSNQTSETLRKVSTDSTSSTTPLFTQDATRSLNSCETLGRDSANSMHTLSTQECESSEATRKVSVNSVDSEHPLLEEQEIEISLRKLQVEPPSLRDIFVSEYPQKDGEETKQSTGVEVVMIKSFSSAGSARYWMYKNVVGVGLSFLFVFSAFLGLQNLQSSINAAGGLGLATLAILYLFFTLSGFVTPGIIKLLGTKYALLGGFLCHLVYTAVNYYPSWYTLVPASALLGFASGPIWAAGNTHLLKVAVISAPWLGVDQNHLIGYIVGIFFGFFQGAQIPGNLASSLIFYPYSSNETGFEDLSLPVASSNVSAEHCRVDEDHALERVYLYILSSVYLVLVLLGLLILLLLVNHFPMSRKQYGSVGRTLKAYFGNPLLDLLKIMKDFKMIFIVPIATVNGLVQAFVFGTFTKAVIVECFGTFLVGFALIVHGVTSALAGMIYSQLAKYIPRYAFFVSGGLVNIGLLVFLVVWTPHPTYIVVFLFVLLWGAADAVWNAMTASLVGIMFPDKSELAYSVHRIWLAIGLGMGFVIGEFLDLRGRCYFVMVAVAIAVVSNLVLEFKTQSKASLLPCCFKTASYSMSAKKVTNTSEMNNGHA